MHISSLLCGSRNQFFIYGKIYNKYTYKAANEPFFKYLTPGRYEHRVLKDINLYDVHSSFSRTFCLGRKKDGDNVLLGSGNNFYGQLGLFLNPNFGTSDANVPQFVEEFEIINLPPVEDSEVQDGSVKKSLDFAISSGLNHTILFIPDSSYAYVSGSNSYGQCGLQDDSIKMALGWIPMKMPTSYKIKKICCGLDHTLLLAENGQVYSCGLNTDCQTANEDLKVTKQHDWARLEFPDNVKIEDIYCGDDFNFAVDYDNNWYSWGNNELHQLALPVDADKIAKPTLTAPFMKSMEKVALGNSYGLGLTRDNKLICWGQYPPHINPIAINKHNPVTYDRIDPSEKITSIYASTNISACITENKRLYVWGRTFKTSIHEWVLNSLEEKPEFFTFDDDKVISKFSLNRHQATMLIK